MPFIRVSFVVTKPGRAISRKIQSSRDLSNLKIEQYDAENDYNIEDIPAPLRISNNLVCNKGTSCRSHIFIRPQISQFLIQFGTKCRKDQISF